LFHGRRAHQVQTEKKDVSLQDIPAAEFARHLGRRIVREAEPEAGFCLVLFHGGPLAGRAEEEPRPPQRRGYAPAR
jgi:hypothetical protein